jgi:hypothetical protein
MESYRDHDSIGATWPLLEYGASVCLQKVETKTREKGLEHLQSKVKIRHLQVFSVVPCKKSRTIHVGIGFLMAGDWQVADVLLTLGAQP